MSLLDRATIALLAIPLGCITYYAWVHRPGPLESGAQEMRLAIMRWLGPFTTGIFALLVFTPVHPGGPSLPARVLPVVAPFCVFSVLLVRSERRKGHRRTHTR
jgi:hypothetical protein